LACATVQARVKACGAQVAYISNLAVVPAARRRGVGRLLVRQAEEVRGGGCSAGFA